MCVLNKRKTLKNRLGLFTNHHSSSLSNQHSQRTDEEHMFTAETEQRIHDWLDSQNILITAPEEHSRNIFQKSKDSAFHKIQSHVSSVSLNDDIYLLNDDSSLFQSTNVCPNMISQKKLATLTRRRRLNLADLLITHANTNMSAVNLIES